MIFRKFDKIFFKNKIWLFMSETAGKKVSPAETEGVGFRRFDSGFFLRNKGNGNDFFPLKYLL